MNPTKFPQANAVFKTPPDLDESQCGEISAFVHIIRGGCVDGAHQTVVAWQPSEKEIADIVAGKPIFLSVLGGLPPHYLSTDFQSATNPA